jgi:sugar lactone lactonase YvrE
VAASFQIQVTKSAPPVWTRISDDDTNALLQFFAPISLSVNRNPASTNFGRIYVLEDGGQVSGSRLTTEGIFVLNADISDAFGQGDTGLQAGLSAYDIWAGTGGSDRYDPFQIEVGDDDYVYISDANDPRGGLLRADPAVTIGEPVLQGVGNTVAPTIHTVLYGVHPRGSLTASNLTVWATDGQWQGSTACNSVLRWDVGAGPLPHTTPPVTVAQPGPATSERDSDLDVAPDGNIFFTVSVDGGSGATGVPAVQVFSQSGTLLWSSVIGGIDVFTNAYSLEVSPDNTKLAIIRRDRQTWIVGLTNGPNGRLPDIAQTNLLATFTGSSGNGRSIAWDLAGNLYVGNRADERVRIFSPGGTTTATTSSTGTFAITVPPNAVTISSSIASISEGDATPAAFTVNRTGNTAEPLTVSFLFTGTASNGIDHAVFPNPITFPAGVTGTNISLAISNDSVAEFTENAVVAVSSGTNYNAGTPGSAAVSILDDETPEISFATATTNPLLESYAPSSVSLQLVRRGLLAPSVDVNLSYSGAALRGADFNGPLTVAFAANATAASMTLTPLNDQAYEGDEIAVANVASGTGYDVGAASSGHARVIDDEYPDGTTLFSDSFTTDSSPLWRVNLADPADGFVEFAWDYGVLAGIPVAPATTDGSTRGLRFRCGNVVPQISALSVSPQNGNFTGDYRLKFDLWINYNGPMPDGGAGSTQHFGAGVGTAGDSVVWFNNPLADGVWFTCSGDGADGATFGDYSAFIGPNNQNDDTGFYAAGVGPANGGLRIESHPFYSSRWGGQTAPAAQLALFPGQTGVVNPGNAGMAWHTVVITKTTNVVVWAMDGVVICAVTNDPINLSTNIFVGYQDRFGGSLSSQPEMSFGLVDNLKVETFVAAPAAPILITGIRVIGALVQIRFTGPPEASPLVFTLQSSPTVTGTYTNEIPTISSDLTGNFTATLEISGTNRFYRIKK